MSDPILVDGDLVSFLPTFGAAVVTVRPGRMRASGFVRVAGKAVCVAGDESGVKVQGCMYVTPQYVIPGSGILTISALDRDHKTATLAVGGKAALLKGGTFTAAFEVQTPAQQPPPGPGAPIPDPTKRYSGKGRFVAANTVARAG